MSGSLLPDPTPPRAGLRHHPCALAIGGLDPGGGAGIAADLRAFAAAGVFGCAAISVLTIQSTGGLVSSRALAPREVLAQAREVVRHQWVRAFKVGALGSVENVRAIGRFLAENPTIPAVLDPVMLPTRGRARLLDEGAVKALRNSVIRRATLITANVPEAEALTGSRIRDVDEASHAALALCAMGAQAALVKGGHLEGPDAVDVLALGGHIHLLRARRISSLSLHGGGCVLASLIAGRMAKDLSSPASPKAGLSASLLDAVKWAKRVHRAALARAWDVSNHHAIHKKSSTGPAPSRTISGGTLVKSMTVLGIIPHAPESTTKPSP